jgi:hypothetical protein
MIRTTMADDAELIWRLADEAYTQEQIGKALGWSRDRVMDYTSLHKIDEAAWCVIVATFRHVPADDDATAATAHVAVATKSPFTEGLLRDILDLTPDQQLYLCTELAKGSDKFSKKKCTTLALAYKAQNAASAWMQEQLAADRRGGMGWHPYQFCSWRER